VFLKRAHVLCSVSLPGALPGASCRPKASGGWIENLLGLLTEHAEGHKEKTSVKKALAYLREENTHLRRVCIRVQHSMSLCWSMCARIAQGGRNGP